MKTKRIVKDPVKRGKVPLRLIKAAVKKVRNKRIEEAADKVLHRKSSSKKEKVKRGSALTQKEALENFIESAGLNPDSW